ncbi:hypothetical protein AV530_011838 [Patagioenas fasciata monilis]|uniref:Uncharacterized protein n=1 Tax=Patagioenas fasciata monilis TaxID=372326 RepID=A0A1V4JUA5_PATFA|nr:hypothetical protein AV530_011838 [Patagioenas fasciata monilis]
MRHTHKIDDNHPDWQYSKQAVGINCGQISWKEEPNGETWEDHKEVETNFKKHYTAPLGMAPGLDSGNWIMKEESDCTSWPSSSTQDLVTVLTITAAHGQESEVAFPAMVSH